MTLERGESACGSSRAIGLVVGQRNGQIALRAGWVRVTVPINVVATNPPVAFGFLFASPHPVVCKLGLFVLLLGGFRDAGRMSLRGTLGTSVLGSRSVIAGLAASQ